MRREVRTVRLKVRFMPRRRGMSLMWTLIGWLALISILSLGVEVGRVRLAKSQLQTAADAAALAGASALGMGSDEVTRRAVSVATANICDGYHVSLDPAADVELGTWDSGTRTFTRLGPQGAQAADAVRVSAVRSADRGNAIPLVFAALIGQRSIDAHASAVAIAGHVPAHGFVGLNYMDFSGGSGTDSYDSTLALYPQSASLHGNIASNGRITLSGGSVVRGDAHPGAGYAVKTSGSAHATGSEDPLTTRLTYPPVDAAPYLISNDNAALPARYRQSSSFSLSGSQSADFPAGTYCFKDFTLSGSSSVRMLGPVTLYVTGKLALSGSVQVLDDRPANLRIRVAGSGGVSLSGSSDLYADIYAPESKVTVSGSAGIFGKAIGRSLTVSGSARLHSDLSLTDPLTSHAVLVK